MMKMKINCEVIKDLLPSYVDGLTSPQSNELIKEHLAKCPDCAEYLRQMTQEIPAPEEIAQNKKSIQPFKKIQRRLLSAVAAAVLLSVAVFGTIFWYYSHSWTAASSEVKMHLDAQGTIATLRFTPEKKNSYLYVEVPEDEENTLIITEKHASPFEKTYNRSAYYSLTFLDDHTIMGLNGKSSTFSSGDVLTIQYQDTSDTISLKELADKALENPPANSENVEMTCSKDNQGHVTLSFQPILLGVSLRVEDSGTDQILIRQYYDSQGEPSENKATYTLTFLDEQTLLLSDGSQRTLKGDETLQIQYENETIEIPFQNLWNGTINE